MKPLIKKCYKIAVIIPAIIGIIAVTIFSIIYSIGYKSEWLTPKSIVFVGIIFSMVYCGIICILALTIFLNLFEIVRKNTFFIICSWFLLPFSFISMVFIHEINFAIKFGAGRFGSNFIPVILINIPFIFGLIVSFVIFLRKNNYV
jgi:hypothetical protein